jgi:hypothetical protein
MQFVGYFSGNHMSFLITLPGPCSRGLAWRRSKHKTGVEFFIRMPQTDIGSRYGVRARDSFAGNVEIVIG